MSTGDKKIRVLIAKPGLDGHDRGAKIVARLLRDAGFEVIYMGLRQSPEAIAAAAADEDVDVVGLSILSGAHQPLTEQVIEQLGARGTQETKLVVGGTIPPDDVQPLLDAGVDMVFPMGSDLDEIVEYVGSIK